MVKLVLPGQFDQWDQAAYALYLRKLQTLFAEMDCKYDEVSAHYGFHCSGCEDTCCRTRFFHHTYLEYINILKGVACLEGPQQQKVKDRALDVSRRAIAAGQKEGPIRLMCPLNFGGPCVIYPYRPMICRLHGIAHELHTPGGKVAYGSGCHHFAEQSAHRNYFKFDRTPFYIQMARLEQELKTALGITRKIKMTIAQMLVEGLS